MRQHNEIEKKLLDYLQFKKRFMALLRDSLQMEQINNKKEEENAKKPKKILYTIVEEENDQNFDLLTK